MLGYNANYFLIDDLNHNKIPVHLETIVTSPNHLPIFTGHFLTDCSSFMCKKFHTPTKKKDPIKKVIFNNPATIVMWSDGTKTVVKCQPGDTYDAEKGLALCIAKKYLGNKGNFNEVFKKWVPDEEILSPIDNLAKAFEKLKGIKL